MKTFLLCVCCVFSAARAEMRDAPLVEINDTINPGSGDYIIQQIHLANERQAPYLVIKMDTPGGLLNTTRQITQEMLSSKIPIVVFVGPKGAHAGSAGALITFAADVAAMAPGTNIGAAHPVGVGGSEAENKVMAQKIENDVAAFAEGLAGMKGRNRDWAVKAVKQSASIPADQALKIGVIDLIAEDTDDLSAKLQSFPLKKAKNSITQLPAERFHLATHPMTLKQQTVSFLADPNISYLIMALGGICIWLELSHPGLIYPGVIGALCLLLSLVSLQALPIRFGALALILLGMGLLIAELFLPSFGILGVGGIIAFVIGSLFLMDTPIPEFQISLKLIIPTAVALAGIFALLSWMLLRVRKLKALSGLEALVGEFGQVREKVTPQSGKVLLQGELWNAKCDDGVEINAGKAVKVRRVERFELFVEPA